MEERRKKLSLNKAGGTSVANRSTTFNLGVPTTWATKLGISENNRNVFIYFDEINNEIIIEKDPMPEDAAEKADILKAIELEKTKIEKAQQKLLELEEKLKELE
ncbi:hypothetical protein DSECCO2_200570 [anaerobic digester metagenome]|jgi:hypothetical protein